MENLKSLRTRLGVTQQELAQALGCVQGAVSFYEAGREIPIGRARRLIAFAAEKGVTLSLAHVYGDEPFPEVSEAS